jgi:hypothetical protein
VIVFMFFANASRVQLALNSKKKKNDWPKSEFPVYSMLDEPCTVAHASPKGHYTEEFNRGLRYMDVNYMNSILTREPNDFGHF